MTKEQLDALKKRKNELIWSRGSAMEIMRLARIIFREASKEDLPGAYVALASDHYSLMKRYAEGWLRKLFAAWHGWRATCNVEAALQLRFDSRWDANSIDVMSRIMATVPEWLGGDAGVAISILRDALFIHPREALPHTRALMLVTLGGVEQKLGHEYEAGKLYNEALQLQGEILREEAPDRLQQLSRVLFAVGLHFYLHVPSAKMWAEGVIMDAIEWAQESSKDQYQKILAECRKHGIKV